MSAQADRTRAPFGQFWASGTLVVMLIATGTLFLIRAIAPESLEVDTAGPAGEPDVHMQGSLMRQFDDAGQLKYELVAPDIRFFRDAGRAEVTTPDLTLYDHTRTAWHVQAAKGTLLGRSVGGAGEDQVHLEDDVVLQPIERPQQARLATAALTLYPERQYAETDHAVIIDGEGGRTAAVGLEGDLQGGLLKLFSSAEQPVQTTLLPGQFK